MRKENLIEDHYRGDTWDGMELLIEDLEDDNVTVIGPLDLTGCMVNAHFKTSPRGSAIFKFSTTDDTITIANPTTGIIRFNEKKIDAEPATYMFDIQLTFPDGSIKTILQDCWTILNDITRP